MVVVGGSHRTKAAAADDAGDPAPRDSAPYVLLQAEHRPGAGLSLDGRTRLAAVFAPNHTHWRLAAWLCRRKHVSAPVGTPIDRIPEKTYVFLV